MKKAKPGKDAKAALGVAEAKLGAIIQEETGIPCVCNELVGEVRPQRFHTCLAWFQVTKYALVGQCLFQKQSLPEVGAAVCREHHMSLSGCH